MMLTTSPPAPTMIVSLFLGHLRLPQFAYPNRIATNARRNDARPATREMCGQPRVEKRVRSADAVHDVRASLPRVAAPGCAKVTRGPSPRWMHPSLGAACRCESDPCLPREYTVETEVIRTQAMFREMCRGSSIESSSIDARSCGLRARTAETSLCCSKHFAPVDAPNAANRLTRTAAADPARARMTDCSGRLLRACATRPHRSSRRCLSPSSAVG